MTLVNKLLSRLQLLKSTETLGRSARYAARQAPATHSRVNSPTPSDQSAISYLSTGRDRLRFLYSNHSTGALEPERRPHPQAPAPRSSSTIDARARRSSLIPSPLPL